MPYPPLPVAPWPIRVPDPVNAPLIAVKPPPDAATLVRVRDGLVRLSCQD
jgi:hypothetical protein